MTATTDLNTEDQYRVVYDAICAIAANCDGAQERDFVGFDGADTKFGRRIAAVPFDAWTQDVREEAARILADKYSGQAHRATGVDVSDLPVVREAAGYEATNYTARNEARGFERAAEGNALKGERKATLLDNGRVALTWHKKDPDCFGDLLAAVRALPGRRWTGSVNEVDLTPEAVQFIEDFAIDAAFDLDLAKAEAVHVAQEAADSPDITLEGDRVRIAFDYDPAKVAAVRSLPGRAYDGATKTNTADLHPDVLRFAEAHGLKVADDVTAALANHVVEVSAEQAEADLRKVVSSLADPAELPADFVARIRAICPKAVVV